MQDLDLREVAHGSADYLRTLDLRMRVLRAPLGLTFTAEDLAPEREQIHLAAFGTGEVVACLILVPLENGQIKMRQVAVAPDVQGQGVGRALVEFSEAVALLRGFTRMVLSARGTAVPFYLRLGYQSVGEPYEEVGLPHLWMEKALLRG